MLVIAEGLNCDILAKGQLGGELLGVLAKARRFSGQSMPLSRILCVGVHRA